MVRVGPKRVARRVVNQVWVCEICGEHPMAHACLLYGQTVEVCSYCWDAFPDDLVDLECRVS